MAILPPWVASSANAGGAAAAQAASTTPPTPQPTRLKVDNLSEVAKECYFALIGGQTPRFERRLNERARTVDCEEDFLVAANSDIAQLCAENIMLWQHFLTVVMSCEPVRQHLARQHHIQRVKRFAEAFFVIDNPRPSASGCYDSNYQNYVAVSEAVRRSRYLNLMPPLAVECTEMDGDVSTLPVIFEDQYQHVAEFARRRSIVSRKSENYLSATDIQLAMDQLDGDSSKREVIPPDVTRPEPQIRNGLKAPSAETHLLVLTQLDGKATINHDSKSLTSHDNKSLASTVFDSMAASTSGYESRGTSNNEAKTAKLAAKKSPVQAVKATVQSYSDKDTPKDPKATFKTRAKAGEGRSRSSDSRVSSVHSGGSGSSKHTLGSGSESDEKTLASKASKGSKASEASAKEESDTEDKPPLPPRTDKMPKDFKPPIPPKTHKLPMPRNSLKEKLKNNLKLELRLPANQGSAYKRAKFKLKLIQRAQQLRSNGLGTHKSKRAQANAIAENVVLLKYRQLEPSLSMPYNLGAHTPGSGSAGGGDQLMRHSQSTLSMPSFLWEVASAASPAITESMPDLLATDSETSSEINAKGPAAVPSRPVRLDRTPPILSNVEVGLVSATDSTLLQIGGEKVEPVTLAKKMPSPVKKIPDGTKPLILQQDSSSNSDITSEQSGWVSNSSRQSSGSSSGQISPDLDIKQFPIKDMLTAATVQFKTNGTSSNGANSDNKNNGAKVSGAKGNGAKLSRSKNGMKMNGPKTPVVEAPVKAIPTAKYKSKQGQRSPAAHRSSRSETRSQGHKLTGKDPTHRSASNDQLQMKLKKTSHRKEVKKSQSLQKVNNINRTDPHVYEEVPLPPPPKEFQDPLPGLREALRRGGFATTGRLPREERSSRHAATGHKDRPRSESPKTETGRVHRDDGYKSERSHGSSRTVTPRHSGEFELDDITNVYESVSEVLNDVKRTTRKSGHSGDKFNSLPSMRRRHQSTGPGRPGKRGPSRKTAGTPDRLSEPTPTKANHGINGAERIRTQSAPPPNIDKSDSFRDYHSSRDKDPRPQRRSDPLSTKSEPPLHLTDSKCTLLELFLEQQGASVWAHREAQRELLKAAQSAAKKEALGNGSRYLQEAARRAEELAKLATEGKAKPDVMADGFDDSLSDIPPPPRPPSP
ncbi:hypothetical protein OTU49_007529, partial [Cherax quadricarinatus]